MLQKGDGHIGRYLYLTAASMYVDTIGDVRLFGDGTTLKAQLCSSPSATKGGGIWNDIDFGGSLWELDGTAYIQPILGKKVKAEHFEGGGSGGGSIKALKLIQRRR